MQSSSCGIFSFDSSRSISSPVCEISLVVLDKCLLQKQSHNITECLAVLIVSEGRRNEENFDGDQQG